LLAAFWAKRFNIEFKINEKLVKAEYLTHHFLKLFIVFGSHVASQMDAKSHAELHPTMGPPFWHQLDLRKVPFEGPFGIHFGDFWALCWASNFYVQKIEDGGHPGQMGNPKKIALMI
jgi:hypothetical protein